MDWAYLAGFTDADGFIVAQRGKAYIAAARIGWTQTRSARWELEEIQSFLNGEGVFSYLGDELDKKHAVTRGAQEKHSLAEWETIAASARVAGARKRPVSVYLGEIASDDVLRAIAKGAA